jgi:DnaK suppressor protein
MTLVREVIMRKTELEKIKGLLLDQRREMVEEVKSHDGLRAGESNSGFRDPEERAAGLGEALVDDVIAGHDVNLLEKIDFALRRIGEGNYENCASCGGPIPKERLLAKPSASLCVSCQAAKEPS